MNTNQLASYLLCRASAVAGRFMSPAIHVASEQFFPDGVAEEFWQGLEEAADAIGGALSEGTGPVEKAELSAAVSQYHDLNGTPYCPPIVAALA